MPEGFERSYYESQCPPAASQHSKAQPNVGLDKHLRGTPIINGDVEMLSPQVKSFVEDNIALCQPENIHICDGSENECVQLLQILQRAGTIKPLTKYQNCWLARTNPADVARVESKTFICTPEMRDSVPIPKEGVKGVLGNWISPEDYDKAVQERFPGCMRGKTMYIIPYSMGPVGGPISKVGVEITDSAYVVCSMRIMTRMGTPVLELLLKGEEFVKCLHSVGNRVDEKYPSWPCDPEKTIILHKPETKEITSYGSGYGGNSLLGKKCFALRIGSTIAHREGWLAEHMLILGITTPAGKKRYIAAAFPSACGKTNLAMLEPSIPGFKVECVGDDIAWMKFDANGQLRGINPENGFFGVAPGTSMKTNPNAMRGIFANTVFTNVAETSDGGVFWEGLEDEVDPNLEVTDWLGQPWDRSKDKPSSHPNSRFCAPVNQCPILDPDWEAPDGVPIDAILFGGRRPAGVPVVYESFNWQHGVFVGASMRSETTAAAEHKGKEVMHDPFAMRPFFGYNFGHYIAHWLTMPSRGKVPKIFHVNWFLKNSEGKFMWPGFGENGRILDWILKRVEEQDVADMSPIGYVPKKGAINFDGMSEPVNEEELFRVPKDFWQKEVQEIAKYFDEQIGDDLPMPIRCELGGLKERIEKM